MNPMNVSVPNLSTSDAAVVERSFIARVYAWMTLALAVTGVVAFATAANPNLLLIPILSLPMGWLLLFLVQIGVVVFLSARIYKLSTGAAAGLFLAYSALTGLTIATFVFRFTFASIATAFFVTAGLFMVFSVIGWVTKADLTKLGMLALMALIGVIIASLVNFFLQSAAVYWVLTYLTVLIFVGLIAWDTQRLKRMSHGLIGADGQIVSNSSIIGALALYLDFINLFMALLRILGIRR